MENIQNQLYGREPPLFSLTCCFTFASRNFSFALFIENVFYTNDWDYPHAIRDWAKLNGVGEYDVKDIAGVK